MKHFSRSSCQADASEVLATNTLDNHLIVQPKSLGQRLNQCLEHFHVVMRS
jgi:hypothetical protein